ncbi:MAG TPA: FHA domain-containing protein [Ottowia sp.]|uniref:FHA domain-containing protein n=1 Tax=Ottowia sp. TaxID=1898956 RepID=UPI002C9F4DE7|nr:FHA domain-containing protein [Ottowia sp.]HMN21884.1 FHA domain-containing protein [Ottowia sp.]
MSTQATVAFFDLSTSSSAFDVVKNNLVAETFSQMTDWVGRICTAYGGTEIRVLENGLVAEFPVPILGLSASVYVKADFESQLSRHREHAALLGKWPEDLDMQIKIGLAHGLVERIRGENFQAIMNSSAHLSRMASIEGILADESFIRNGLNQHWDDPAEVLRDQTARVLSPAEVKYRSLGHVSLPGFEQQREAFQILWRPSLANALTVPSLLEEEEPVDRGVRRIKLGWLGEEKTFEIGKGCVHVGRSVENDFVVGDNRVSREHVQIRCVDGDLILVDMSRYGTFVRFDGESNVMQLKRTACSLLSRGEMALGGNFTDYSTTVVSFETDP